MRLSTLAIGLKVGFGLSLILMFGSIWFVAWQIALFFTALFGLAFAGLWALTYDGD